MLTFVGAGAGGESASADAQSLLASFARRLTAEPGAAPERCGGEGSGEEGGEAEGEGGGSEDEEDAAEESEDAENEEAGEESGSEAGGGSETDDSDDQRDTPEKPKKQVPMWRKDKCYFGLEELVENVKQLEGKLEGTCPSAAEGAPLRKLRNRLRLRREECANSYAYWVGKRDGLGPMGRQLLLAATMRQHAEVPKRYASREQYFESHGNLRKGVGLV